ncbi:hypothetical protein JB92DRAFT_3150396 [Gautieria morchelliformis]|nr:hypothetical protein JB92DRAFT_3150396 [Gautieria morchelliformis]
MASESQIANAAVPFGAFVVAFFRLPPTSLPTMKNGKRNDTSTVPVVNVAEKLFHLTCIHLPNVGPWDKRPGNCYVKLFVDKDVQKAAAAATANTRKSAMINSNVLARHTVVTTLIWQGDSPLYLWHDCS